MGSMSVISCRGLSMHPGRCYDYEFEDLLCAWTGARLVAPRRREAVRAVWKRRRGSGFQPVDLEGPQELLFVNAMAVWDLTAVDAVTDWRSRSRVAVCWIKEFFASTEVPAELLATLRRFDLVVLNFTGSVAALQRQLPGVEVLAMPLGIDALRFAPTPPAPVRSIDVHWVGRNDPVRSAAILAFAEGERLFYHFNTGFADAVSNHVEHRLHFAAMMQRTRLFVVFPAKFNDPATTGGQRELGYRYLEGVCSGAALIGEAPPEWATLFPGVALASMPEAAALPEFLTAQLQAERITDRRAQVATALGAHDWIERVDALLSRLGVVDAGFEAARDERRAALRAAATAVLSSS